MQLRIFFSLSFLVLFFQSAFGQDKIAFAARTPVGVTIDGQLNDEAWLLADPISDFLQTDPVFKAQPSQPTEVRILYDNRGIYVGARLFDNASDSILRQLGNRDDHLNSDLFTVQFDTYSNGLDAFIFEVYASGVQRDSRLTDRTFNAVWGSAVAFDAKGWTTEFFIPWSALRFPDSEKQLWKVQIQRNIRRNREQLQWAPEPKGAANKLSYWGQLNGFRNIKPPFRLSISPYTSTHIEHYPYNIQGSSNYSTSISGGADLKYGVSKSFTLDMTLLPDFSTVASDHEVKNLSAFETVYDEKREFFKEGTNLFMKGNLFYTRRIGRRPMYASAVSGKIEKGSTILRNPDRTQLINAAKLSGRTSGNTGIGFFNAITANTYATYEDSLGVEKKFLTEPLANYNIIVIDQGLNYNSSAYLINTNVTRDGGHNNENVTGAGVTYVEKSNTYRVEANGSLSQIYRKAGTEIPGGVDLGYRYALSLAKINGKFQYALSHGGMDAGYNINGLGMSRRNDELTTGARVSYHVFEPFGKFLRAMTFVNIENSLRMSTGKTTGTTMGIRGHLTTRRYKSFWGGIHTDLTERYDYYEPRTSGRYYLAPISSRIGLNFSSDFRKPLALNAEFDYVRNTAKYSEWSFELEPIIRFSDRWSIQHQFEWSDQANSRGYVRKLSNGDIIFGNRDLLTVINTMSTRYIFLNNLSLSFLMRHYWFRAEYDSYFTLNQAGRLEPNATYTQNHDFNFNTFNIDLKFEWEFLPGSNLSIVYKNALNHESSQIIHGFIDNWRNVLDMPNLNSLTLKLLYYIDSQSIISRKTT